jgi:hypothetical protein
MDLLAKMGKNVSINAKGETVLGVMDAESAKAEIARLGKDATFRDSLFDKRAPKHAENTERWQRLHEQAYPTQEPSAPAAPSAPAGGGDDAKTAARAKIEELIGNATFMGSLRDKAHPDYAANRAQLDSLQQAASEGGTQ